MVETVLNDKIERTDEITVLNLMKLLILVNNHFDLLSGSMRFHQHSRQNIISIVINSKGYNNVSNYEYLYK